MIFTRRRERVPKMPLPPIVIEMSQPLKITRKETKIAPMMVDEARFASEMNKTEKILNMSLAKQKANGNDIFEDGEDVEILRIPFELKNDKPVRNQIKEFIGGNMPELMVKPRRGRPTVKRIIERSLIKNRYLYQMTLDSSEEGLRYEESSSKKVINKILKQIYGRDIQQQLVIDQAVNSIINLDYPPTDNICDQNVNFNIYGSTQNFIEGYNINVLTNDIIDTSANSQPVTISHITNTTNENVEIQNIDILGNVQYDANGINFSIMPTEQLANIQLEIINTGTEINGEHIILTSGLNYDNGNLVLINVDNSNVKGNELDQNMLIQSTFPALQIMQPPNVNATNIPESANENQTQPLFGLLPNGDNNGAITIDDDFLDSDIFTNPISDEELNNLINDTFAQLINEPNDKMPKKTNVVTEETVDVDLSWLDALRPRELLTPLKELSEIDINKHNQMDEWFPNEENDQSTDTNEIDELGNAVESDIIENENEYFELALLNHGTTYQIENTNVIPQTINENTVFSLTLDPSIYQNGSENSINFITGDGSDTYQCNIAYLPVQNLTLQVQNDVQPLNTPIITENSTKRSSFSGPIDQPNIPTISANSAETSSSYHCFGQSEQTNLEVVTENSTETSSSFSFEPPEQLIVPVITENISEIFLASGFFQKSGELNAPILTENGAETPEYFVYSEQSEQLNGPVNTESGTGTFSSSSTSERSAAITTESSTETSSSSGPSERPEQLKAPANLPSSYPYQIAQLHSTIFGEITIEIPSFTCLFDQSEQLHFSENGIESQSSLSFSNQDEQLNTPYTAEKLPQQPEQLNTPYAAEKLPQQSEHINTPPDTKNSTSSFPDQCEDSPFTVLLKQLNLDTVFLENGFDIASSPDIPDQSKQINDTLAMENTEWRSSSNFFEQPEQLKTLNFTENGTNKFPCSASSEQPEQLNISIATEHVAKNRTSLSSPVQPGQLSMPVITENDINITTTTLPTSSAKKNNTFRHSFAMRNDKIYQLDNPVFMANGTEKQSSTCPPKQPEQLSMPIVLQNGVKRLSSPFHNQSEQIRTPMVGANGILKRSLSVFVEQLQKLHAPVVADQGSQNNRNCTKEQIEKLNTPVININGIKRLSSYNFSEDEKLLNPTVMEHSVKRRIPFSSPFEISPKKQKA